MSYGPSDLLKKYWLEELGCSETDLQSKKTIVRSHGTLIGYPGIMVFKREDTCLISAPERLVEGLETSFCQMSAESAFDPLVFKRFLGDKFEKVVGPAWLGQITPENYLQCHDENVRELSAWESFEEFLLACPPDEVELSSLQSGRPPVKAVFQNEKIVTAAGFELMERVVAHIGILTHPAFRGRGYAKQAISAIVDTIFQMKLGPQYWTHEKNLPSIRAASDIGFKKFAATLAIRIK